MDITIGTCFYLLIIIGVTQCLLALQMFKKQKDFNRYNMEILDTFCEHGKPRFEVGKNTQKEFNELSKNDKILLSKKKKSKVKTDEQLWELEQNERRNNDSNNNWHL